MGGQSEIAKAFRFQIAGCAAYGSPFSAALLEAAIHDAQAGGPAARLLAPWGNRSAASLIAEAFPLRLLGALHDLALDAGEPAITAAFPAPGQAGDASAAWEAAREALPRRRDRIARFMGHEPQTNEVRRSACLLGGFLVVAEETDLPLRCFELGASAGLNQLWDRYRYTLNGAGTWGDPGSAVGIDTEWRGPPPLLGAPVAVIERAACDRTPVDLADPEAARRLRAYVWADQFDRLRRLDAAVAAATAAGTRVEAEDAVTWAQRRAGPGEGAATVLFHSVFWQYLPPAGKAALAQAISALGASASPTAPFAWLRMEPAPDNPFAPMELRLTLWPGGEARLLAACHAHGAWVEWTG